MTRHPAVWLFGLALVCPSVAGAAQPSAALPLESTALTLAPGACEMGLVLPLRCGTGPKTELELRPLLMLVAPNLGLKHRWLERGAFVVSSRHGLLYPSGIYELLAREGVGGILPHESRVPLIVATTQALLVSYVAGARAVVTGKLATTLAARFGREQMTSIDLPWIYARQAPHRRGWSLTGGVDLVLGLPARLTLDLSLDAFRLGTRRGRFGLEQHTTLAWQTSARWRWALGYVLTWQQYPFGAETNLGGSRWPLPTADVRWTF